MASRNQDDAVDENQPPTMIVSLDDILLCHVLPRVPAKAIVRFKCVSKGWYSFLSTPMFARMHQSHHQNHHKVLFISTNYNATTSPAAFSTIDCEAPEDGFTSTRRLPFKLGRPQSVSVITSLNGLACLGIINRRKRTQNEEYSRLILWNPLTGDYKTLPKTNACKECYEVDGRAFVLYYISSQDDYKLLRVTNSCNVYIYSLRSDLWRKIEPTEDFHRLSRSFSNHSASLNGKLYVLKEDEADAYSIITLDPETDKFTEATTPFFRGAFTTCSGFTVLRGFIHVWMRKLMGEYRHIDLWRMDGDGDWTKLETLYETPSFPPWMYMQPLHLMADGKWLMCCDDEECLYKTDPEKPTDKLFWSYTTTVYRYTDMGMDILPGGKYIETLVSPNQYMK